MKTWYIHAFKNKLPNPDKDGDFYIIDSSEVIIEADNETEALSMAKKIIKRKYYRVFRVWEKPENILHDEMHMKSIEIQAKLLKGLGIK